MKNFLYYLVVILVALTISGFAINIGWAQKNTEFNDQEVLDAFYSGEKVPDGFFKGITAEEKDSLNFTVYVRDPVRYGYIYCANNFKDAEICAKKNIPDYGGLYGGSLIRTSENEKFFEFITKREANEGQVFYTRFRVLKASYIELSKDEKHYLGQYPRTSKYYFGKFGQKPVTKENIKQLIEFLWYSVFGHCLDDAKVLRSFTEDEGNIIKHTMYETYGVGGDWGLCDQVTLMKSEYVVNKKSGEITAYQEIIKNLQGKYHPNPLE